VAAVIELNYGVAPMSAQLHSGRVLGTIDVADVPALDNPVAAMQAGLADPIGMDTPVTDLVHPGQTVTIVVSDSFRHTRIEALLPSLIDMLNRAGVTDERISFLFATGSHRVPNPEEAERILGSAMFKRFRERAFAHEPANEGVLTRVGTTERGTPAIVNRRAIECDHLLVTGAVVLHYFGGFGGGRKSIVPGLASLETIAANHSLNLHPTEDALNPDVRIGSLDTNPVAEDMLEAARLVPVTAVINTVMNRDGAIAGVYVGELEGAHRAAAAFAESVFTVPIAEQADLVLASAGAAKNFVQCHKALFNAHQAMRPGGRIVLLAEAPEGFGNEKFRRWLELGSREAIIAELRRNAEINGQTALSCVGKGPSTILVSSLSEAETAAMGARKAASLEAAANQALTELRNTGILDPTVYVMPSAAYSVPILQG